MNWISLVVLRTLVGNVLGPVLTKVASVKLGRVERFALQYFFASAFTLGVLYMVGFTLSRTFLLAIGIGFANGFGAYCEWRAVDLSLSKTALFSWGSGLIAALLGYALLDERVAINPMMASGIALAFFSTMLLAIHEHHVRKKNEMGTSGASVYLWIAGYTVIWGVVIFLERVFAMGGVGTMTFLGGWYFGSFLVGLILLAGVWKRTERMFASFTLRNIALSASLAFVIVASLGLEYWMYRYTPLIVAQPLFLILGAVAPALIGLFYFKEARKFDRWEWIFYGLGALGACLIVVGFMGA